MSRPDTRWRRWEENEIAFLRRFYQYKGAEWVAERLDRTLPAVYHAADRYVVRREDQTGKRGMRYMSATEAAILCDTDSSSISKAAKRDGVRKDMAINKLIPSSWVYDYRDRLRAWRNNEELGWYGLNDIRRTFRISNSSHMTVRRWFVGRGKYGFAFVERVEMRLGRPTGRKGDGTRAYARIFNPWHAEALYRDIRNKKPDLTERCSLFLAMIRLGHRPVWQAEAPAQYHFPLEDRCVGPFPQALGAWLRRTKVLKWARDNRELVLTDEGIALADEYLNTHGEHVLGSAA